MNIRSGIIMRIGKINKLIERYYSYNRHSCLFRIEQTRMSAAQIGINEM